MVHNGVRPVVVRYHPFDNINPEQCWYQEETGNYLLGATHWQYINFEPVK
jgi:hypothetical protein